MVSFVFVYYICRSSKKIIIENYLLGLFIIKISAIFGLNTCIIISVKLEILYIFRNIFYFIFR